MKIAYILFAFLMPICAFSQQIPDTLYNPAIANPAYASNEGPIIFIDEGHHNFHTKEGRYKAFSNLLERDGYIVNGYEGDFNLSELYNGKILVISNALNEINVKNWVLPTPSAFSISEIESVKNWVNSGGSLFLIADHMPMAGAAEDLAKEFGFEFTNGFVLDTINKGPAHFNLKEKSLHQSIITKGRTASESVIEIVTFTGQAIKIPDDATPILTFNENFVNLLPHKAWEFDKNTSRMSAEGWSQGAFKNYGEGRIVVFGEAAMFSAQLGGPNKNKMGMNNEVATENHQLLLNIIHWLDGILGQ